MYRFALTPCSTDAPDPAHTATVLTEDSRETSAHTHLINTHTHTHTLKHIHTHTNTHSQTHTHTHTHTHTLSPPYIKTQAQETTKKSKRTIRSNKCLNMWTILCTLQPTIYIICSFLFSCMLAFNYYKPQ